MISANIRVDITEDSCGKLNINLEATNNSRFNSAPTEREYQAMVIAHAVGMTAIKHKSASITKEASAFCAAGTPLRPN